MESGSGRVSWKLDDFPEGAAKRPGNCVSSMMLRLERAIGWEGGRRWWRKAVVGGLFDALLEKGDVDGP